MDHEVTTVGLWSSPPALASHAVQIEEHISHTNYTPTTWDALPNPVRLYLDAYCALETQILFSNRHSSETDA